MHIFGFHHYVVHCSRATGFKQKCAIYPTVNILCTGAYRLRRTTPQCAEVWNAAVKAARQSPTIAATHLPTCIIPRSLSAQASPAKQYIHSKPYLIAPSLDMSPLGLLS